jgi:competence protein ComEC
MVVGPLTSFRPSRTEAAKLGAWCRAAVRSLAASATAERDRWALWIPAGFGGGIAIYFGLAFEPPPLPVAAVACAGLLSALAAARTRFDWVQWCCAGVATLALGFACAKLHTDMVSAPVLPRALGPVRIEGRIETLERRGQGARIVLSALLVRRMDARVTPRRARLTVRVGAEGLAPGQWIAATARLMPPPEPAAPGSYDFGRAAFYEEIGAVGFVFGRPEPVPALRPSSLVERVSTQIELLRAAMTARIRSVLAGSNGAIAAALITGDRGGIDPSDTDAYRDAGIAHVLSISGLHLALAGGFFFWLVRALLAAVPAIALNRPIKKWAAVAALAGATFYVLISGCDAPAVRSYIMLAMMFGAILADRMALTMRNVALAALVVLAFRPQSLIEPGFQMSFGAVVGLIALAEWQRRRESGEAAAGAVSRVRRYVLDIAWSTAIASLATTPFAIYHFDRSTQYGLISNLLTVPLTGFVIMPAATAAMVLMPFGLERLPLFVMGKGVAGMTAVAHLVAGLPRAAALAPAMPVTALLLFAGGGLWIALWRGNWRWLGILPVLVGLAVAVSVRGPDLLVARDAATVAIRDSGGVLHFVRPPRDRYSADQWLRRDGDARDPRSAVARPGDGIRCDAYGCIASAKGTVVAVAARIDALREDCANAQIVVSEVPVRHRCRGPRLVIDRTAVERAGGYAVWLGSAPRIETVEGQRGLRPWSAGPRARSQYRRMRPTSLP